MTTHYLWVTPVINTLEDRKAPHFEIVLSALSLSEIWRVNESEFFNENTLLTGSSV